MTTPIRIKSFANGLRIQINDGFTFEEIADAVASKFNEGRKFFGDGNVAIAFEGKLLSFDEEDVLCDIITANSDLQIMCVLEPDEDIDDFFKSSIRNIRQEFEKNDICYFKGSIINEEMIDCKKDVVIIGDVNPGCTIITDGSIFVYGGLYGEAYAGVSDPEDKPSNKIIMAMEMAPEELKIGNLLYEPAKKSKWGIKAKLLPQIAYASNDKINIEPYTKELLDRLLSN